MPFLHKKESSEPMRIQYRINQLKNCLWQLRTKIEPVDWVFIYGLPRSGTTYVLNNFMKISRTGIGDWMMEEFAIAIEKARCRYRQTLDIPRLVMDLRLNLLENAPVGGGSTFDISVKQTTTSYTEFKFWKEMFHTEPAYKLFLYREPNGWRASALEKFRCDETECLSIYKRCLETYAQIGGNAIPYDRQIFHFLKNLQEFKNIQLEPFEPTRTDPPKAPRIYHEAYQDFLSTICTEK